MRIIKGHRQLPKMAENGYTVHLTFPKSKQGECMAKIVSVPKPYS